MEYQSTPPWARTVGREADAKARRLANANIFKLQENLCPGGDFLGSTLEPLYASSHPFKSANTRTTTVRNTTTKTAKRVFCGTPGINLGRLSDHRYA